MKRIRPFTLIASAAAALIVAAILGIGLGSVRASYPDVLALIGRRLAGARSESLGPLGTIIFEMRLPRVVLSAMVGSALATGGVCFQAVLRNSLADPYIIGVSSGAGFGAAAGMAVRSATGWSQWTTMPIFAFIGAALATAVVYGLSRRGGRVNMGRLLLAGVAVSAFLTAMMSLLMLWRQQDMQRLVFWMMGGFSGRTWEHVGAVWPYIATGLIGATLLSEKLNLISLGEERAFHMGLAIERTKALTLGVGAMLAAAAVSVSGVIGFVGLMIPHIARLLIGPDHRTLIPASMLIGAGFVVAADTVARVALSPVELPIGILTALCGTPFFLWLLRQRGENE